MPHLIWNGSNQEEMQRFLDGSDKRAEFPGRMNAVRMHLHSLQNGGVDYVPIYSVIERRGNSQVNIGEVRTPW